MVLGSFSSHAYSYQASFCVCVFFPHRIAYLAFLTHKAFISYYVFIVGFMLP
uniref:Uncharacterized protein n=1 Tax=Rhizophora mucronata TaxID=61149 RepID=A0A2P2NT80_RHIMU